ncbi:family 1 glycosylhydrolase [Naasia aerilata]|uniref:Glycosyl hydrolase family 1 n=1 Tax=Naasia aerilata TaxID=1162966 RepID=A0ABM8GEW2_9MICO|nr:family 1 glycosylhydrolase [Naasia aerilata]BDZ46871.1 hypothetical protein GCM10025866_27800 [Naasia aerilata]
MALPPIEIIGAFESTYMPAHDRDVFETTEHDQRWRADLALLEDAGVTRLRYPIRWHRLEAAPGVFDWTETDEVLEHLRASGFRPIVDLVHHTSYPAWLTGGFADPRFGSAYLRYAEAFARRYPWIEEYTLFNEPFSTLFLSGHEAVWPPYLSGMTNFVDLLANVLPAVAEASRLYRRLLPGARHIWTDTCEFHTGSDESGQRYADMANERRFLAIDAFLGRGYDPEGPLGELLEEAGATGSRPSSRAPLTFWGSTTTPTASGTSGTGAARRRPRTRFPLPTRSSSTGSATACRAPSRRPTSAAPPPTGPPGSSTCSSSARSRGTAGSLSTVSAGSPSSTRPTGTRSCSGPTATSTPSGSTGSTRAWSATVR